VRPNRMKLGVLATDVEVGVLPAEGVLATEGVSWPRRTTLGVLPSEGASWVRTLEMEEKEWARGRIDSVAIDLGLS
jgi:hypothetical protein